MLIACVAAALGLVVAATPAGASSNFFQVTGGSLVTVVGTFPLVGTPTCGSTTGGATVDIAPLSGGSHVTTVTAVNITTSFVFSGNTYIVDITRAPTGTHTGSLNASSLAVSQSTRLTGRIYLSPGCVRGSLVCTATANITGAGALAGPASAAPDPVTGNLATGETLTLSGSGPVVVTACPSPLDVFGGSTVSVSGLELTRQ
jgi:hypothetical protein